MKELGVKRLVPDAPVSPAGDVSSTRCRVAGATRAPLLRTLAANGDDPMTGSILAIDGGMSLT